MTRTTNARVAGFTFLFYIAAGVSGMFLFAGATGGEGIAARLASIAQHATAVRVTVLLVLLQGFCALVLGVTLHAITREQDPDLAMLGLTCRVVEGITGIFVARTLGLLWLATAELVVILPLQLAGLAGGFVTSFMVMWVPMLVFEVALALWLLIKRCRDTGADATGRRVMVQLTCP